MNVLARHSVTKATAPGGGRCAHGQMQRRMSVTAASDQAIESCGKIDSNVHLHSHKPTCMQEAMLQDLEQVRLRRTPGHCGGVYARRTEPRQVCDLRQ